MIEVLQELHGTLERVRLVVVVVLGFHAVHSLVQRVGQLVGGRRMRQSASSYAPTDDDDRSRRRCGRRCRRRRHRSCRCDRLAGVLQRGFLDATAGRGVGAQQHGATAAAAAAAASVLVVLGGSRHSCCLRRRTTGRSGYGGSGRCQIGRLDDVMLGGGCAVAIAMLGGMLGRADAVLMEHAQLAVQRQIAAGPAFAHRLLGAGRFQVVAALVAVLVSERGATEWIGLVSWEQLIRTYNDLLDF